ncbi:MAG: methyltransferase domain-containing protein [Chloroflexi bacterium]|nr:methyltransferase domain-containing protein [Chloroflexota bacterium]
MPPGQARISPLGGPITESRFTPENFQRVDEEDDGVFYEFPRLVVHIDDGAIAAIGRFFKEQIPENAEILDLMSSWRSHWPQDHPKKRMVGLGLNDVEMRENPDLDGYVVHNVNINPILPFENETFDAVVITVSAQYLTKPVDTFHHVNRILRPGGVFIVSFSNRMFPTKAVLVWRNSTDRGRIDLVGSYMESAENFEDIQATFINAETSPPDDPMYVVSSRKSKTA